MKIMSNNLMMDLVDSMPNCIVIANNEQALFSGNPNTSTKVNGNLDSFVEQFTELDHFVNTSYVTSSSVLIDICSEIDHYSSHEDRRVKFETACTLLDTLGEFYDKRRVGIICDYSAALTQKPMKESLDIIDDLIPSTPEITITTNLETDGKKTQKNDAIRSFDLVTVILSCIDSISPFFFSPFFSITQFMKMGVGKHVIIIINKITFYLPVYKLNKGAYIVEENDFSQKFFDQ